MTDSGLKAARLALGAGISKGYLSELLKGRKEAPSFEVVKKFADVLGCSPRWLLTGHEAAGISPTLPVEESPAPLPSASPSAASAPLRFASSSEAELLAVLLRIAAALERLAERRDE